MNQIVVSAISSFRSPTARTHVPRVTLRAATGLPSFATKLVPLQPCSIEHCRSYATRGKGRPTQFQPDRHLPHLKAVGPTGEPRKNFLFDLLHSAIAEPVAGHSASSIVPKLREGASTQAEQLSNEVWTKLFGRDWYRKPSLVDGPIRSSPPKPEELLFHPLDEVTVINPDDFFASHPYLSAYRPITLEEFEEVAQHWNLSKDAAGFVAAISGGPDSMALALLLAQFCTKYSIPLLCITVDHALRPEAPAEALVTQGWLQELGVPHVIIRVDWHGHVPTHGIQLKARDARYEAITGIARELQERLAVEALSTASPSHEAYTSPLSGSTHTNTLSSYQAQVSSQNRINESQNESFSSLASSSLAINPALPHVHIVMAHTTDDNVETFWLRLAGCSGSYGLAGIASSRIVAPNVSLIRPLLGFPKNRLYATLIDAKQPWASDPSNAKLLYKRNQIRHTLEKLYNSSQDPSIPEKSKALEGIPQPTQTSDSVTLDDLQSLVLNFSRARLYLDILSHRFCQAYVGISAKYGYAIVPLEEWLNLPELFATRVLDSVLAHVSGDASPTRLKTMKSLYHRIGDIFRSTDAQNTDATTKHCIHRCILVQHQNRLIISMMNVPNAPAYLCGNKTPLPPYRADTPMRVGAELHWLDSWLIHYQLHDPTSASSLPDTLYIRQLQLLDLPVLQLLPDWKVLTKKLTRETLFALPILVDDHSRIVHFPFSSGFSKTNIPAKYDQLVAPRALRKAIASQTNPRVEFQPKYPMTAPPTSTFVGYSSL